MFNKNQTVFLFPKKKHFFFGFSYSLTDVNYILVKTKAYCQNFADIFSQRHIVLATRCKKFIIAWKYLSCAYSKNKSSKRQKTTGNNNAHLAITDLIFFFALQIFVGLLEKNFKKLLLTYSEVFIKFCSILCCTSELHFYQT